MDMSLASLSDEWQSEADALDDLLLNFEGNLMRLADVKLHAALQQSVAKGIKAKSRRRRSSLLDCIPERRMREWYQKCKVSKEQVSGELAAVKSTHSGVKQSLQKLHSRVSHLPFDTRALKREWLSKCKAKWVEQRKLLKTLKQDVVAINDSISTALCTVTTTTIHSSADAKKSESHKKIKKDMDPKCTKLLKESLYQNNFVEVEMKHDTEAMPCLKLLASESVKSLSHFAEAQEAMANIFADAINEIASAQNTLHREVVAMVSDVLPDLRERVRDHYFKPLSMIANMPTSYFESMNEVIHRRAFAQCVGGIVAKMKTSLNVVFEMEFERRRVFLTAFGSHLPSDLIPALNCPMDCIELKYLSSVDSKRTPLPDIRSSDERCKSEAISIGSVVLKLNRQVCELLAAGIGLSSASGRSSKRQTESGSTTPVRIDEDSTTTEMDFEIKLEQSELRHRREMDALREDYETKLRALKSEATDLRNENESVKMKLSLIGSGVDAATVPSAPLRLPTGVGSVVGGGSMAMSSMMLSRLIDSADPCVLSRASQYFGRVFTADSSLPDAPAFDLMAKTAADATQLETECSKLKADLQRKDEQLLGFQQTVAALQKASGESQQRDDDCKQLAERCEESDQKLDATLQKCARLNAAIEGLQTEKQNLAEEIKVKDLQLLSAEQSRERLLGELHALSLEKEETQAERSLLLDSHMDDTRTLLSFVEDLKLLKMKRICVSADFEADDLVLFARGDCLNEWHADGWAVRSAAEEMPVRKLKGKKARRMYFALVQSRVPTVLNDSAIPRESDIFKDDSLPCFLTGQIVLCEDITLSRAQYGFDEGTLIKLLTASSLSPI